MKLNLLEKAAQQALSEVLGYDEARAYYLLLLKKEDDLEKEFSYSKRYRLMRSLFLQSAAGKIKPKEQDFFSYIILPPSFLYFGSVEVEIVEFLEKLYLKNFLNIFENDFSQIILRDEKVLLLFLLKNIMKEEARIEGEEFNLGFLGERRRKVELIGRGDRRIGRIDNNLKFEFVNMPSVEEKEYI